MRQTVLTRAIGSPLYHQVYHILRSGIISGRYPVGSLLAPEEALARDFAVSRVTVRKAMQALEAEGLIERLQGRGTRVLRTAAAAPSPGTRQFSVPPAPSSIEIREFETVSAGEEVARRLQLAAGAPVYRFVRIRSRDGVPVRVISGFVPVALTPSLTAAELAEVQTLSEAFDRRGLAWAAIDDEIGAVLADRTMASLLAVTVGAAVVEVVRTLSDARGHPLACQVVQIAPERDKLRRRAERGQADITSWEQGRIP